MRNVVGRAVWVKLLGLCGLIAAGSWGRAEAGGRFARRATTPVELNRYVPTQARTRGTLGTFSRTPYIFVRGNGTAGGGYSPLGEYGDSTMVLYGPISSLRMTSAPVMTYSRGYDGRGIVSPGTSFSTPNMPSLTPVISPTQGTYYFAPRQTGNPPWWANGMNWIDQN